MSDQNQSIPTAVLTDPKKAIGIQGRISVDGHDYMLVSEHYAKAAERAHAKHIVCDIMDYDDDDVDNLIDKVAQSLVECRPQSAAEPEHRHELLERIQDYLAKGGLFNPELMEHDKVQQLLLDCRTYIVQHEKPKH